jgi:8-oxo-dGTP diphosphatase
MARILKNNKFQVVNFVVLKDSSILVEERSKTAKVAPGDIAILGGHCEDEDHSDKDDFRINTLKRELKEELDIVPTNFAFLCTLPYKYKEKKYEVHYYVVSAWEGKIGDITTEDGKLIWLSLDHAETKLNQNVDKIALKLYLTEF